MKRVRCELSTVCDAYLNFKNLRDTVDWRKQTPSNENGRDESVMGRSECTFGISGTTLCRRERGRAGDSEESERRIGQGSRDARKGQGRGGAE